jgi:hypothetical protein
MGVEVPWDDKEFAWRIAGGFAIVASILSFFQIRLHVKWYGALQFVPRFQQLF